MKVLFFCYTSHAAVKIDKDLRVCCKKTSEKLQVLWLNIKVTKIREIVKTSLVKISGLGRLNTNPSSAPAGSALRNCDFLTITIRVLVLLFLFDSNNSRTLAIAF